MSISHGIHCQPLLDLLFFCGGGGLVSNSLGCGPNGGGVLCLGVYRGGGVPTCSESDAWRAKVFLHSSGMLSAGCHRLLSCLSGSYSAWFCSQSCTCSLCQGGWVVPESAEVLFNPPSPLSTHCRSLCILGIQDEQFPHTGLVRVSLPMYGWSGMTSFSVIASFRFGLCCYWVTLELKGEDTIVNNSFACSRI